MARGLRGARLALFGLALGVGASGLLARSHGVARAADRAERPARIVVEVARGEGAEREQEEAVVRGVVRAGAEVELVRVEQPPRLGGARFARVVVRASDAAVALELVLEQGTSTRSLARSGSAAVIAEELALAVESALESAFDAAYERPKPPPPVPATPTSPPPATSLATPTAPAPKPPPPAPAPLLATTPPAKASLELFTGVFGGVGSFASNAGAIGRLGGELGLASQGPRRPALALRVGAAPGFASDDRGVEAHATVVSVRLRPSTMLLESPIASLGLGLGLGVDLISVQGTSKIPGVAFGRSPLIADPVVSPTVMARLPLASFLAVTGSFAVDVGFRSVHWVTQQGGVSSEVFSPSHARPVGLVGLELAVWDSAPRAPRDGGKRP